MSHMPLNHRLLPAYRVLAALCGLYILAFGIAGVATNHGLGTFAQDGLPSALGLRANRAFAVLSIVAGVAIVAGAVIGRSIDRWINLIGGLTFLTAGIAMMLLLQTDLDFLGFTMATCIVSFVIGMVLFSAGLYGRTGPRGEQAREEQFRHGERNDPQERGRFA
jgi:Domain of unknown function (DUF4383)